MKPLSESDHLEKLGSENTQYVYEGADKSLLERFPNPMNKGPGDQSILITAPEFTSLCPKTGQPDFATIVLKYTPKDWCVESKAWKLYLGSYRNVGEFHESCVRRIVNDLIWLLDPKKLQVVGEFTPRGGIPFWPKIKYRRPELIVKSADLKNGKFFATKEHHCSFICEGEQIGFVDEGGNIEGWGSISKVDHTDGCASFENGTLEITVTDLVVIDNDDLGDASTIAAKEKV